MSNLATNRERIQHILADDFARVRIATSSDPLWQLIFFGFENKVTSTIEILAQYEVDLIIAIPIKNKQNLETVFKNFAFIDLQPLKVGVIFGLDMFNDPEWYYAYLKPEIAKVSSRFVFIEPFKTTFYKPKGLDNFLYKSTMKAFEEIGMKGCNGLGHAFIVVREEMRMLIKGLNCKHVLWVDADEVAPQDVISRLMRHIENADLVAGWALDRHYPFEKTTFETLKKVELESKEEKEYYEMANDFVDKLGEIMTICIN